MSGWLKLFVLAAVFAAILWFLLSMSSDKPASVRPDARPQASSETTDADHDAWSKEDRAIWRDKINQRLAR
ncbi:MAG: hypothetical protein KDG50_08335 [Chromatiales bacterium]|nr:hypothetical protein [Chromatiales bacterium]